MDINGRTICEGSHDRGMAQFLDLQSVLTCSNRLANLGKQENAQMVDVGEEVSILVGNLWEMKQRVKDMNDAWNHLRNHYNMYVHLSNGVRNFVVWLVV